MSAEQGADSSHARQFDRRLAVENDSVRAAKLQSVKSIFTEGPYSGSNLNEAFGRMIHPGWRLLLLTGDSTAGKSEFLAEAEQLEVKGVKEYAPADLHGDHSRIEYLKKVAYEEGEQAALYERKVISVRDEKAVGYPFPWDKRAIVIDDPNKPWPNNGLDVSSDLWGRALRNAVNEYEKVLGEAPGFTAATLPNTNRLHPASRNLGFAPMHDLFRREGRFKDVSEDLEIDLVVLFPGAFLRLVMPWQRHAVRTAWTLEQAQARNILFGKKEPLSKEKWEFLRGHGATLEQIAYNRTRTKYTTGLYQSYGHIPQVSPGLIREKYIEQIRCTAEVLQIPQDRVLQEYIDVEATAELAKWTVEKDFGIQDMDLTQGKPHEGYTAQRGKHRVFFGLNDPTPAQLGIDTMDLLRNYLYQTQLNYRDKGILFYVDDKI